MLFKILYVTLNPYFKIPFAEPSDFPTLHTHQLNFTKNSIHFQESWQWSSFHSRHYSCVTVTSYHPHAPYLQEFLFFFFCCLQWMLLNKREQWVFNWFLIPFSRSRMQSWLHFQKGCWLNEFFQCPLTIPLTNITPYAGTTSAWTSVRAKPTWFQLLFFNLNEDKERKHGMENPSFAGI